MVIAAGPGLADGYIRWPSHLIYGRSIIPSPTCISSSKVKMMKSLTSLGAALLAASPVALAQDSYGSNGGESQCSSIDADEIRSMGNNTLFTRWRPYSHVNAPAGWLNDPCAPMYDPTRDEYHIFYQFHPNHINW